MLAELGDGRVRVCFMFGTVDGVYCGGARNGDASMTMMAKL